MEISPTWAIESVLIDMYWLLAHRIKGLGWSLNDFWSADTWTTSKLYCMEMDLIDKENKEFKNKKDPAEENSPEMENLYAEMFGNEE